MEEKKLDFHNPGIINDNQKFDLFISFYSADRYQKRFDRTIDVVSEIKKKLERYNHPDNKRRLRVCSFEEDFELDLEVSKAISSNINQSRGVLFLSTNKVGESKFVSFELDYTIKTKDSNLLLTGLVNQHPHKAFPAVFSSDALSANFSFDDCNDLSTWRKKLELEAAKIAARIWNFPLKRVRDRFILEKRKRRLLILCMSAVALLILSIVSLIGFREHQKSEAANIVGAYQRYAADMVAVQQFWTKGEVDAVNKVLDIYSQKGMEIDPRSFEWYTYKQVVSAEHLAFGKFGNSITSLAASQSKNLIAFATEEQPVKIYSSINGELIATLSDSTIAAPSLTFSPDGLSVAAISKNKLFLFNTVSKHDFVIKNNLLDDFVSLYSTANNLYAIDNLGSMYRIQNGNLQIIKRRLFEVDKDFRFQFSSDEGFIVGITGNGKLQIVDAKKLKTIFSKVFSEFTTYPSQNFAMIGNKIVFLSGDHISIFDIFTKKVAQSDRLCNGNQISGLAVNTDENIIAAGDPSDYSVVFWKVENIERGDLREIGSVKGYRGWLNSVIFIPKSTKIVASSLGGNVKIWDYSKIGNKLINKHHRDIKDILLVPNNKFIVTSDSDGSMHCWNPSDSKEYWNRSFPEHYGVLALFGKAVAVAGDSIIYFIDLNTGKDVGTKLGYEPITSTSDGNAIAYVSNYTDTVSGTVTVETIANKNINKVSFTVAMENTEGIEDYISSLTLPNKTNLLLVANAGGKISCFDIKNKKLVYTIIAHKRYIYAIESSLDGNMFATASVDSSVSVWNTKTGNKVVSFREHNASVQAIAFSPDGKIIASGSQVGLIKLSNIPAKLSTISFTSHTNDLHPGVTALAFSSDGTYLVSGGAKGTIIIWDAARKTQNLSNVARQN